MDLQEIIYKNFDSTGNFITFIHPRNLLEFRIRNGLEQAVELLKSSNNNKTHILQFFIACCRDLEFSFEFSQYGGHGIIKRGLCSSDTNLAQLYEEIIASIINSGCGYPQSAQVDLDGIRRPARIVFEEKFPLRPNLFSVYIRPSEYLMHGKGQQSVGYVLWPSSTLLSRLLVLAPWLILEAETLEIGSGLGLSGFVASRYSKSVIFTDFNQIVLKNLHYNILLNSGPFQVNGEHSLSGSCELEVFKLDFYKDLSNNPRDATKSMDSNPIIMMSTSSEYRNTKHNDDVETDEETSSSAQRISSDLPSALPLDLPQDLPSSRRIISSGGHDYIPLQSIDNYGELPISRRFPVIIGADVICCEQDAIHCARVIRHRLLPPGIREDGSVHRGGLGIFVLENPFHRFGVEKFPTALSDLGLSAVSIRMRSTNSTSTATPVTPAELNELRTFLKNWMQQSTSLKTNNRGLKERYRQLFVEGDMGWSDEYWEAETRTLIDKAIDAIESWFDDSLFKNITEAAHQAWDLHFITFK